MFQRLAQRLVVDVGLGGDVLKAVTADCTADETLDLVERLGVIYDIVCPPPEKK